MNRAKSVTLAVASAAVTWLVYVWFGNYYESDAPIFKASILLASVVVHELFHMYYMERAGVRTHLIFLVVLGGAVPAGVDRKRFRKLPWDTLAQIYLAGVTGNIAFVIASIALYLFGVVTGGQLSQIVNLNGQLILYNLLPFFIFDGGRFARVLFDSTPENEDREYASAIGMAFMLLAVVLMLFGLENFTLTAVLIYWGLQFRASHDDPAGSHNQLAMSREDRILWSVRYLLLLAVGLGCLVLTKPWIDPNHQAMKAHGKVPLEPFLVGVFLLLAVLVSLGRWYAKKGSPRDAGSPAVLHDLA